MSKQSVALVTGGSQGIGLATVRALAAKGFTVVAMGRNPAHFTTALESLPPENRERVTFIVGDVRDEESVRSTILATTERFGRLDVLVNSAGVSMNAKRELVATSSDEWRRIMETNLTGTYLMCREALPHLLKSPRGYILNVQSTAAHRSGPGTSLYAASKFGVRAMTDALIEEYRNTPLRISSVSPGPVATSIWDHKLVPPGADERARMIRPSDIADVFIWLLERPAHLHIPDITVTPWTSNP